MCGIDKPGRVWQVGQEREGGRMVLKNPALLDTITGFSGEVCQAGLGVLFVTCQATLVKPTFDLPFNIVLLESRDGLFRELL